jgi:hypothetical protein
VSLILEALKKLDREKQAPDRGVVVVGPSAWPSPREGPFAARGAGLVLGALLLGAAAGAFWILRGPGPAEPPGRPSVAAAPAQQAQAAPDAQPAFPAPPPVKADASRPDFQPAPARAAGVRPKARPAPTEGAEAAPAASGEGAESTPPEVPAVAEAPPSQPAPRRSGAADFQLQAISAQNGQPVAMLNDRLVREGDTFDNVRVVRIGTDEVEIEVAGRRRIVKF